MVNQNNTANITQSDSLQDIKDVMSVVKTINVTSKADYKRFKFDKFKEDNSNLRKLTIRSTFNQENSPILHEMAVDAIQLSDKALALLQSKGYKIDNNNKFNIPAMAFYSIINDIIENNTTQEAINQIQSLKSDFDVIEKSKKVWEAKKQQEADTAEKYGALKSFLMTFYTYIIIGITALVPPLGAILGPVSAILFKGQLFKQYFKALTSALKDEFKKTTISLSRSAKLTDNFMNSLKQEAAPLLEKQKSQSIENNGPQNTPNVPHNPTQNIDNDPFLDNKEKAISKEQSMKILNFLKEHAERNNSNPNHSNKNPNLDQVSSNPKFNLSSIIKQEQQLVE